MNEPTNPLAERLREEAGRYNEIDCTHLAALLYEAATALTAQEAAPPQPTDCSTPVAPEFRRPSREQVEALRSAGYDTLDPASYECAIDDVLALYASPSQPQPKVLGMTVRVDSSVHPGEVRVQSEGGKKLGAIVELNAPKEVEG